MEHINAMMDLTENLAEGSIIHRKTPFEDGNIDTSYASYTIKVPNKIGRIFTALASAGCLKVTELPDLY